MSSTLGAALLWAMLAIQLAAALFFFSFGIYCCLMVWLHARNKRAMIASDAKVMEEWLQRSGERPIVTVQLPVYNERYVVARSIEAAVRLDYPRDRLQIQILDDSNDETTEIAENLARKYRAEGFDIAVHRRADRTDFKAGALREATKVARGEFIAIFDADFVPYPDFLYKTMPFFDDPRMAAVQTLWGHLNADYSQITRAQSVALDGVNYVFQAAQCWSGVMMHFQGTAGVWRKEAIGDAGGWQGDTLTEDVDLSYRAQIKGWRLKFLPQVLCPGELPPTLAAAKTQQHRWVKGGFQTARKLFPKILASPNISSMAKLEASYHMIALGLAPSVLIMALVWPAQMWLRQQALFGTVQPIIALLYLASFGPTLMFLYAQRDLYPDWKRRLYYYIYTIVWGLGIAVTNARGILEVVFELSGFVRTPKFRIERKSDSFKGKAYVGSIGWQVVVETVIAVYCLTGEVVLLTRPHPILDPFLTMFTIGIWAVVIYSFWERIGLKPDMGKATAGLPSDGQVEAAGSAAE